MKRIVWKMTSNSVLGAHGRAVCSASLNRQRRFCCCTELSIQRRNLRSSDAPTGVRHPHPSSKSYHTTTPHTTTMSEYVVCGFGLGGLGLGEEERGRGGRRRREGRAPVGALEQSTNWGERRQFLILSCFMSSTVLSKTVSSNDSSTQRQLHAKRVYQNFNQFCIHSGPLNSKPQKKPKPEIPDNLKFETPTLGLNRVSLIIVDFLRPSRHKVWFGRLLSFSKQKRKEEEKKRSKLVYKVHPTPSPRLQIYLG